MFLRFLSLWAVLAALSPALRAQTAARPGPVSLHRVRYLNFDAYRLSDGRSEAVIVPALGRVMRYGLTGGANLLWNSVPGPAKRGEWRNWGGDKSWPAPQNRWPLAMGREWPPHPSWDGEPYRAAVLPPNRLRLTSGIWPRFECRVVREFSFEANGDFVISQTYEKLGGPPVELALWNITQVAAPDAIFASANPQSAYNGGFHWLTKPEKLPDISFVRPDMLRLRSNGAGTSKIGIDAPLSSVVVVTKGLAWKQQAARPEGNYPDGAQGSGFPIEIFDIGGVGSGHYLETELLSPLRLFYTGSRWTYAVKWSLHPLGNKALDAPELEAEMASLLRLP